MSVSGDGRGSGGAKKQGQGWRAYLFKKSTLEPTDISKVFSAFGINICGVLVGSLNCGCH